MKTLSRIVRRHICRANHAWKVMQTVSLILEYEDVRRISPNNPWLCLYETLCTILGGQCHVGMSWLLIASSTLSPNIKRNVWEIREICCNIENSLHPQMFSARREAAGWERLINGYCIISINLRHHIQFTCKCFKVCRQVWVLRSGVEMRPGICGGEL